eukprot:5711691-Pleurochrysis_carterae.AAC.2
MSVFHVHLFSMRELGEDLQLRVGAMCTRQQPLLCTCGRGHVLIAIATSPLGLTRYLRLSLPSPGCPSESHPSLSPSGSHPRSSAPCLTAANATAGVACTQCCLRRPAFTEVMTTLSNLQRTLLTVDELKWIDEPRGHPAPKD